MENNESYKRDEGKHICSGKSDSVVLEACSSMSGDLRALTFLDAVEAAELLLDLPDLLAVMQFPASRALA